MASLRAERDATKGAFFPVLDMASKHASGDRSGDNQKDLQDMESMLKELMVCLIHLLLMFMFEAA